MKKRTLSLLLATACSAALLAGCGSSSSPAPAAEEPAAEETEATEEATEEEAPA